MPLTIDDFVAEISRASQEAAQYLTNSWIEECADIVRDNKDDIEDSVARHVKVGKSMTLSFQSIILYTKNFQSYDCLLFVVIRSEKAIEKIVEKYEIVKYLYRKST